MLTKPVSLSLLTRTVCDALDLPEEVATRPAPLDDLDAGPASGAVPFEPSGHADFEPSERAALREPEFAGRRELYEAFRASCIPQFVHDIGQGDRALRDGDRAALRRLGHNLKSILALLGEDGLADRARQLDQLAQAHGDLADTWSALRAGLVATFRLPLDA